MDDAVTLTFTQTEINRIVEALDEKIDSLVDAATDDGLTPDEIDQEVLPWDRLAKRLYKS